MKPVELVDRALVRRNKPGDVVVDVFGGTGTILIVRERRGRKAGPVELDPRGSDVIVRCWQDYTGKRATLEGYGHPFDEVPRERMER